MENALVACAEKAALAAGGIARQYYRNLASIETKGDASPVTIADKEAEASARAIIRETFPDHSIIGEEGDDEIGNSPYCWVIDPIDGTKSFIAGKPSFGALIACMKDNIPVVGVMHQPITRELWIGTAKKTTFHHTTYTLSNANNTPAIEVTCKSSTVPTLKNAIIATTGPQYLTNQEWIRYQRLAAECRFPISGGDCYNYCLLASGHIDIIAESGLKWHDIAALLPILQGAGAVFSDWSGKEIQYNDWDGSLLVAGNTILHQYALNIS